VIAPARAVACAALALAAAGCSAHRDLVVLVPSADGHVGKVAVASGASTEVIDKANQAVSIGPDGMKPETVDADRVQAIFGDALAAAPIRPHRFTLYFDEGTEKLTASSEAELPGILADIKSRAAYQVEIIGHTDRKAGDDFNDALSLRRAGAVRDWLASKGVPVAATVVVGRGERDPVVATADGTAEPRNRRVELIVR
jgi:outer membrane protein OmpA-like peptidoglycan-associated protein